MFAFSLLNPFLILFCRYRVSLPSYAFSLITILWPSLRIREGRFASLIPPLFKNSPFYLGPLSSYHFLFDLSAPVPDSLPHFCFAFRVFPHLFRLSSSLSLSLGPSFSFSLFRISPVLHLRLSPRALIWPPGVQLLASFSLQFFRHRLFADGHDGERILINLDTPFYFSLFPSRYDPFILIHRPVSRPAVVSLTAPAI